MTAKKLVRAAPLKAVDFTKDRVPAWVAELIETHLAIERGVVVLFMQIGALWLEAQHPCGFPAGATPAR